MFCPQVQKFYLLQVYLAIHYPDSFEYTALLSLSLSLSLQIKQVSSKLVNKKVSKLVNLNCRALIVKISCYLHGTEIRTFNINFCINKSKRSCKNTMKVMQILYTILYNVSIIICTMFWDYIYNIIFVFLVLCIGEHIELISFLPCNSFH